MMRPSFPSRSRFFRATLVVAVAASIASPPPRPARADDDPGLDPIVEVEGISQYRLDNGLAVLLFPDPSVSTVTVNITYLVGSRHEGRGETGMAHLLEHMVFKGTASYPNIWGALQDHGANFNGTTWVDRTNYFETLAASEENLDFALDLEADRMINSRISGEDLAKEMTVVRNEFEMGENEPTNVLMERMMSAAFLWHNYGKSTIGNRSDIERVPVENLRRFYETYYQPDNAMLVIAGNFAPDFALERVRHHFGGIPRPQRTLADTYTIEPTQDGERSVVLRRVGSIAAAGVLYHTPPGAHPDNAALEVLGELLTDRPGGRLYKALVESDKAVRVTPFNSAWREPGVLYLEASIRLDQDVDQALGTMIDVVEGAAGNIGEEEVTRAKGELLKEINLGMTDSRRIGIVLSEWEAMGDWRLMFVHRDRIREVTAADVNRVAGSYLLASNRTSGRFLPTPDPARAEIPSAPDLGPLLERYTGSHTIERGGQFDATAANIEHSTWRGKVGTMDLALLPKKTRGSVVRAELYLPFGTEEALRGRAAAVELLPDLMLRGTQRRDFQGIRDELNRIETELELDSGPNYVAASIKTTKANLPAALDLLAEVLKAPTFPADELAVLKKQRLARLERMLTDPQGLVFTSVTRAMNPYPPESLYYVPTLEEQIEAIGKVERSELAELHRRFLGAQDLDASFVGDFDPEAVKQSLASLLGDWRAEEPYERANREAMPLTAVDETIDTPDKEMAIVVRGTTLAMRDDDGAYPALRFANFILGQSSKSLLLTALRHEGGLSYGAGSLFSADDRDRYTRLMGYAICAPQNARKTQAVMQAEFHRWLGGELTDDEIAEIGRGYREEFDTLLGNDAYVAAQLLDDLETGRPFTFHEEIVESGTRLGADEIRGTLRRSFTDAVFVDFVGGDVHKFGGTEGTGSE